MSVTDINPLQNIDEINRWDNRPFSGVWPDPHKSKQADIRKTIKKKPKRIRTAYTTSQLQTLEKIFTQEKYINSERRREISKTLKIGDKCIKIWFQNRRMKEKRESSESSGESLNDITESGMSPPLASPISELQSPEITRYQDQYQDYQVIHQVPDTEINKYQLPDPYQNWENHATGNQLDSSNQNSATISDWSFYNDCNIYPTQYYPSNENGCPYSNNNMNYRRDGYGIYNHYWTSNNMQTCYYQN